METLTKKKLKSLWREKGDSWSFFCPVCRATRKLPYLPVPSRSHYIQLALTTVFITLVGWKWFNWRGLVFFIPLWIGFELFYRSRVRLSLDCPQCGFDPSLYLIDSKRARDEMENYWRKKFAEKGIPFPEKGSLTEVVRER